MRFRSFGTNTVDPVSEKDLLQQIGSLVNPLELFEAQTHRIPLFSQLAGKQTAVTEEGRDVRCAWRHSSGNFCPIKVFLNAEDDGFY